VIFAWSFTTLPVAAKYQMSFAPAFLLLETGFTLLRFCGRVSVDRAVLPEGGVSFDALATDAGSLGYAIRP
jgi:hypothetical protein